MIAGLAAQQRGVVSREQLLTAGVSRDEITHRVRVGRLHVVHRGVYLVGHTVHAAGARELAALLACGRRSVLSHATAAGLWRLITSPGPGAPVHVTVVAGHSRLHAGIRVHRVRSLARKDVRTLDGLRVTSPSRTLLDLAADVPSSELDRAFAEAQVRRLVSARGVADQLERNPGRAGVRALRSLIDASPVPTRSEAERRLLRLIRSAGLPEPRVNARVRRFEVDFVWPEHRLVVEVDGYAFHRTRRAFERDRERDATLAAAGYTVLRVTWRQLVGAPEAVLARIAGALAARGG